MVKRPAATGATPAGPRRGPSSWWAAWPESSCIARTSARRKVDGGNVAAIIFVAALGVFIAWLCWQGPIWVRVIGIIAAAFATLLILVGMGQNFTLKERYDFEGAEAGQACTEP